MSMVTGATNDTDIISIVINLKALAIYLERKCMMPGHVRHNISKLYGAS